MPSARKRASARPTPVHSRHRLFLALIVAAGLGTYWNSLRGPFIWDDQISIVTNASIHRLWPLSVPLRPPRETPVAGRPVVNLSFALNYAVGGLSERGYHVANIAIHIACALLLFGIVRRTLEGTGVGFRAKSGKKTRFPTEPTVSRPLYVLYVAAGASLLWMLHPLQSEAVDYITQRTESLMGLCFLMTLYASIRARTTGRADSTWWVSVSIVACACGMASKESMSTAPLVVVLYDRVFAFTSLRESVKTRTPLYLGLAVTWLVLAALLWQQPRTTAGLSTAIDPWTYLLNQARLITRYLWLSVWPRALVLDYGLPRPITLGSVLPAALLLLSLLAFSVVALVRWPAIGFLCVVFFLTLAPTSSVVPIASEVGAERRMYLPFAAVAALAVLGFGWLADWKLQSSKVHVRVAAYVGIVVLGALGVRTAYRNSEYRDPLVLWRTVVDRWPHGRARMALATELSAAGDHSQAIAQLREAIREFPDARAALGTELVFSGNLDEGTTVLRDFIRTDPSNLNRFPAHLAIAQGQDAAGRMAEAATEWRAALTLIPNNEGVRLKLIETLRALAEARMREGKFSEGQRYGTEVLQIAPNDAVAHNLVGVALASTGNMAEAIPHFRRATEIDPSDAQARANLERALISTSRPRPRTDGFAPR